MCATYSVPVSEAELQDIIKQIEEKKKAEKQQLSFDLDSLISGQEEAEPVRDIVIRPTGFAPVKTATGYEKMKFGFKVEYSTAPQFNARSETVATKSTFAKHFRERRCLIPAAYYVEKGHKFYMPDGRTMFFAGIYKETPSGEKEYTILTRDSSKSKAVAPIHDRMPVIIPEEMHDLWLAKGYGIESAIDDVVMVDK